MYSSQQVPPLHGPSGVRTPLKQQQRFSRAYQATRFAEAIALAKTLSHNYPDCPFAWKALGTALLEGGGAAEPAGQALQQALALAPEDPEVHNTLAKYCHQSGQPDAAIAHLETALAIRPAFDQPRLWLTKLLLEAARYEDALKHIAIALESHPDNSLLKTRQASALIQSGRFSEGLAIHEALVDDNPEDPALLSNLGNAFRSIGRYGEAEAAFRRAFDLDPGKVFYYSNLLQSMHYNPEHDAATILEAHRAWDGLFRPASVERARAASLEPARRLRVGMISAGFRIHPVGQMITSTLEALSHSDFELVAYTMNEQVDGITTRLRARVDQWHSVSHLDDAALARRIRDDHIDILFDLCGHTEGNRMVTFAMEPAPLQVKWVGGQINTTGLQGMDYMITDAVETPPGEDSCYSEKLIRMPDDYICYMPRGDAPKVGILPALQNGHVTFGCFNNPSKVNPVIIARWAAIMRRVPGSRLFLKGNQYTTKAFVERIQREFEDHGIEAGRLLFEGHSLHRELLECYNRVDIALDPWPYSGGLTTCEALLMGVPVITRPGPTFAGRHSATHLTHAGLPELVAPSWDEYESLAVELASDLQNLATIRRGLRRQLQTSPVCDYRRFATNLATVLRAIWVRHCEGDAPAALSFDDAGRAWFEDESTPCASAPAQATPQVGSRGPSWQLPGRIVTVDNGGKLFRDPGFEQLLKLDAFTIVGFDPACEYEATEPAIAGCDAVQRFPHALLGNGEPTTLHACLDPAMSATLRPLAAPDLPDDLQQGAQVLTSLPVNTVALDRIEGLGAIDWLILDHRADSQTILEHGEEALRDTLLLLVRIPFQTTHQRQPNLAEISHWAVRHGFRFYRLNDFGYERNGDLPEGLEPTELRHADALFIPSRERLADLDAGQCRKLAFLLHSVFGINDLAYRLLERVDPAFAADFLTQVTCGQTSADARPRIPEQQPSALRPSADSMHGEEPTAAPVKRHKIFVVGFPKSGTSTLQKALQATGYRSAHWQTEAGDFVGKLMYRGMAEHDDPWFYLGDYDAITQADVCLPEHGLNFWPNLDFSIIAKIEERHPDCLFILNYRDPAKTVSSIKRWNTMQGRFTRAEIPGLPPGKGSDSELVDWIQQHMAAARRHFEGKDNFIEVDIENKQSPRLLGQKLGTEIAWWGVANKNTFSQAAVSEVTAEQKTPDIDKQSSSFASYLHAEKKAEAGECLREMLRHHDLDAVRRSLSNTSDIHALDTDTTLLAGQALRSALPTLGSVPEYPPFSTPDSPLVHVVGTSNARGFGSSPFFLSFFSSIGAEAYLLQDREYQTTLTRTRHVIERLEPGKPVLLILGAEPRLLLENRFGTRPYDFGELMDSDYRHMESAARRYLDFGQALQASARGPLLFLVPLPTLNAETNTLTRYMIDCLYQYLEGSDLGIIDPFEAFIDASTGLMDTRLQITKNETELHFNHEGLEIIMSRLIDQGFLPPEAMSTPPYQWDNMIPLKMDKHEVRIWNDPARSLKSDMTAATIMMDRFADYLHGCYLGSGPQGLVILNARQGFLPSRLGTGISRTVTCLCLDDTDARMCRRLITFTGRLEISVSTSEQYDSQEHEDLVVCAYPDDDPQLLATRTDSLLASIQPEQIFVLIPQGLVGLDVRPEGYTLVNNTNLSRRHIALNWQNCQLIHLRRSH